MHELGLHDPETRILAVSQLFFDFFFQHWQVYKDISEIFILVPALLGLKGNLEMTLASRLSTAVSKTFSFFYQNLLTDLILMKDTYCTCKLAVVC